MEVLASVIGSLLAESCRFVFGCVRVSIKNFFKRQSNLNALKKDMSSLMNLKDDVRQKLDQQDQLGILTGSQVGDWLRQVDEIKRKVEAFLSTSDDKNLQDSCCSFPLQCELSNKLARKIEEVKKLWQAGNEVLVKMVDVSDKIKPVEYIPGPSIIGQKTASKNLARLLDLLSNDGIRRIGVWGMGGIGKTTLVQNLNNSAPAFSVIIWTTVSRETNLTRIQKQIAERLNLEVNNEERMAIRLHDRLLKERQFLLILDDVWEVIDLDRLGIPRPELCPRSKIVITSRKLNVCRGMMTQANLEVKVLNDDEAWELFRKHAGKGAEMVSKECAGLPLAIIVVGASMQWKKEVPLWNNALRELQMSEPLIEGTEDKVFKSLKWSYDSLQCKRTKFCFLFCCLYPEDFEIKVDELVRYWFCEGLLEERLNYEQIKNQGIATIHKLRDCCLLEPGTSKNRVKMHDVVRDVGIWIAESVENECKSLVRCRIGLISVSENELLSSYKRLSFMNNQAASLPDSVVQCPEVATLLLRGNWYLRTIPASFLEAFQALKILDLSESRITSLPSLLQLYQLRALVLSRCRLLKELPSLDGLSRLLLLDCSLSGLIELPQTLEKLSNLRQLDISCTKKLETIPYSALSKLSNLEFLNISLVGNGETLFEVLPLLKQLTVLYVKLDGIPFLTSNNVDWFKRIKEFHITIQTAGRLEIWQPNMADNSVILSGVCLSQESIGWLLCNANNLEFDGCEGLTQMFNKSVTDNISFARLKKLTISDSDIPSGGIVASFDLLPNLEEISLFNLSKLESLSDFSRFLGLRFARLKRIVIHNCCQLKCVVSLEENQTLEKLEEIDVSDCEMLKSLINYPNYPHMNPNPTAPYLQKLSLRMLPNLKSLWINNESWKNLECLQLLGCHGIRKLPLTVQNAESIKSIRGGKEWWNRLEWDSEDTKMLLQKRFISLSVGLSSFR